MTVDEALNCADRSCRPAQAARRAAPIKAAPGDGPGEPGAYPPVTFRTRRSTDCTAVRLRRAEASRYVIRAAAPCA